MPDAHCDGAGAISAVDRDVRDSPTESDCTIHYTTHAVLVRDRPALPPGLNAIRSQRESLAQEQGVVPMSIESKDVPGAAAPTTNLAPVTGGSPRKSRLPRWVRFGTPIAILAIAAAVEAYIWIKNDGDGTQQVMLTWYTAPAFVFALLLWWTFLSGFAWTIRLASLGLLGFAILVFGSCLLK